MKKYVIHNLASNSFLVKIKNLNPIFESGASGANNALTFDTKGEAESLAELVVPDLVKRTSKNNFWCDGVLLTIVEVIV